MGNISHDSETPAHGQQVITACAFIYSVFDGVKKIFLAKRAHTKKFLPGKYELPGGHIDFGEDIVEGLAREIKEEFNMEARIGDPFAAFTYLNEVKGAHAIEVVYFAQFLSPFDQIQIHDEDHAAFGWFTESDIKEGINPPTSSNDVEKEVILKGL